MLCGQFNRAVSMGRFLKIALIALAGVVGLFIVAAIALVLFFDPNDFKDEISAQVRSATGREFVIDGDISLSLFPWLAVEVGHSELGNAPGFGDDAFASFSSARLSVRLLPLIVRQEIAVGTASLESLVLNLEVAADGSNNWQDLAEAGEPETTPAESGEGAPPKLDIANVAVSDARLSYRDAQAGSSYAVSGLSIKTGRIAGNTPFDLASGFEFEAEPGDLGGNLEINGTATLGEAFSSLVLENLVVAGRLRGVAVEPTDLRVGARRIAVDTAKETVEPGEVDLEILGLTLKAQAKPFSYAGDLDVRTTLRVLPFSLKELMQKFGSEPPVTADPAALTQVSFESQAAIDDNAMRLTGLSLELDDTTMTGKLSVPLTEQGRIEFDLSADAIDVDKYMAPADDESADQSPSSDDIEIPVDLIRSLKAHGTIKLARATLSGMIFEDMQLGLNSAGGKLRLHPIKASLFDGTYGGDVRIDASTDTPSISTNEKIAGVSLTPLAKSLFDQENISGKINGSFELSGRGANLAAIRRDLDGNMAFELADGAWEGTDVWYQLRSARALFKKEQPPERRDPPRTEFTSVIASGKVTDGVFSNQDLLAELPFLQLTGKGTVDLVEAKIDYSLQARVLERPEFVNGASEAELKEFTQAVIPLAVTGPLSSPSIRPDIDGMLRAEVKKAVDEKKDELRNRLMDKLLGGDKPAQEKATGDAQGKPEEEKEKDAEDKLKDSLKNLFDQ